MDKISSLYSQISGGIVQSFEMSSASSKTARILETMILKF
ncbi:hypothetical protein [Candidatus Reidiella endopervernicosa]